MEWVTSLLAALPGRALVRSHQSAAASSSGRAITDVGWLVDTESAGFIWEGPTRLRSEVSEGQRHAKSVSVCPAVLDMEARRFVVPCPITARLRLTIDEKTGEAAMVNVLGDRSPIRPKALADMVKRVPAKEWRHPARPIIQFITPYVFLSDEPVHMTQTPPFAHFVEQRAPGLVIGGRFPIDVWPRHLMVAFEWHDLSQDLVLSRGDPWFYVAFESADPSRPIRLREAVKTPELAEYMQGTRSVANYVGQTFSLFKTARERRPPRLLVPR